MSALNSARERAAFAAGIEAAWQMALTAAITIEVREDARAVREQAAAAALQGLAEGVRAVMSGPSSDCTRPAFADHDVTLATIGCSYDGRVLG